MSLINAAELAVLLRADDDVRVCDVRYYLADHGQGRREFEAGHVPGAVFVDLHTELAGGPGGGRHPLPRVAEFVAVLARNGITRDTHVVVYDDASSTMASRLWWMLRSIGHQRVSVLDGGFAEWLRCGNDAQTFVEAPTPATYDFSGTWSGTVNADEVASALSAGVSVIDARAEERFRGEVEPIDMVAGHIPGAVNITQADNVDASKRFKPIDELRARFTEVGHDPIAYCGSGVSACHNILAMSLVGISDVRLYPGSWSEWSSDPDRPVATGG